MKLQCFLRFFYVSFLLHEHRPTIIINKTIRVPVNLFNLLKSNYYNIITTAHTETWIREKMKLNGQNLFQYKGNYKGGKKSWREGT